MSASSSSNPMSRDEATLLPSVQDKYGGVMTEMSHPMDPSLFSTLLRSSLSTWTLQGKKGVWIKLPKQLIGLAETAVKEGFWFHHAEKDYLMLVYWIPKEDHTLPANASHRVGIGAFVINHNREVLVVQEKTGRFQGQGIWKFPTGVVNEGEDIHDGSVREVKEETGVSLLHASTFHSSIYSLHETKANPTLLCIVCFQVDTEFDQILAFRQTHKAFFGKSDLFFVCMLKPLSLEINAQESEIEAAQWMPWEEYIKQPFVQNYELLRYMTEICSAKTNGDYEGFTPLRVTAPDQQGNLYYNTRDLHSRN
ncbi:nudix hydrolase 2 isoform X3 [Arabidopsis lyrata subsp. lyrata]|nr:nudix hydrolase 2 isoform X3 [Arabidopsis lyrata subsp. lyrata]XP_020884246.1 nudix hydrolase 2 isoform X3 [Arabidopsis lyrata subsp. lyrata]XP_020884249.1 nudix hydrolase 2 isoform X3 [Arabidopsis lyrata subsp. lyrata]|eukprot:XP_020884239.1 nudix hydrolase 2 isoform X3 [Arabidopsis lyrata subsp. lyrata]